MNQNPTQKVLSSMRRHGVQSLLMGGQACVLYGAAEFSRDADFAIMAEPDNLERLNLALSELEADVIAVPLFSQEVLARGHAVHFRCKAAGVDGFRIDVMSKMRGVDDFSTLWDRRTTLDVEGLQIEVMALPDLVKAKKTQRSKDWSMIERLIQAHWFQCRDSPSPAKIQFWLKECRTHQILLELVSKYPEEASALAKERKLLKYALQRNEKEIIKQLEAERLIEVEADRAYWAPLRKELEQMRHARS